jgi:Fe-Mn family superoxide dismutase
MPNSSRSGGDAGEHILRRGDNWRGREEPQMAFTVPELPYAYDALEPHIDAQTMQIHHDKHHQAYVDNANKALEGTEWADGPVEELLKSLDSLPQDKRTPVQNNVGGHANHTLFWEIMGPSGRNEPGEGIAAAINAKFGSFEDFKKTINQNGVTRFGSGWSWLVWNGSELEAYSTPNQDSPLMQGHVPILGVDVWEHAYYLKYQNRRPDYLEAWWSVVNWDAVDARFDATQE